VIALVQRGLFAFCILLVSHSVCGAVIRVPLPPHHQGVAYDQAFYLVTDTGLSKRSVSGALLWNSGFENRGYSSVFVAFDTVYVYGASGVLAIDADIGSRRWYRPLKNSVSLAHVFPYLAVQTATDTVYLHPETGAVMMTEAFAGESLESRLATSNGLTDGKTQLTVEDGVLTVSSGVSRETYLFRYRTSMPLAAIEAYIWVPPTLSLMTASEIVFWPYIETEMLRPTSANAARGIGGH
jgi:hypothetical protein